MIIYLIFILLINIAAYKTKGIKIILSIIFLFSAMRYNVGYDYKSYYLLYSSKSSLPSIELFPKLIIFISRYFDYPQLVYIIHSFIGVYVLYKIIVEFSYNKKLSVLVYLCFPCFYLYGLSTIRQSVAVLLVIYSYKYIKKRFLIKYLIVILIAINFHVSALISIPSYFIYKNNFSTQKKFIYKMLLMGIFFIPFNTLIDELIEIISKYDLVFINKLSMYLKNYVSTGGKLFKIIFIILEIVNLIYLKKIKDKETYFFISQVTIGIILHIYFYKFGDISYRLSLYYYIYYILLIPEYIKYYNKKFRRKLIFFIAICLNFIFLGMIYRNNYLYLKGQNNKSEYIPYRIYINKNYEELN